MKTLAGREFFEKYGPRAEEVWPEIRWCLFESSGTWSSSPEGSEISVLIGDAYNQEVKETILSVPTMRWVHTENTGTDGDFYGALLERGIILTRSAGANAPETAEFVFAAILWFTKRLAELREQQISGLWSRLPLVGLCGKTILVAGLGAVGGRVARIAKTLNMHVLGIRRKPDADRCVDEQGTLDDLPAFLPRADFIVLALPLTSRTDGLIGAGEFALLKDRALLVNVARGGLVDIDALRTALTRRPSLQVFMDVMPEEPWPSDDGLWRCGNLFLTPHVAWSSPHYRERAADIWLDNLSRYRRREGLRHTVAAGEGTA